VLTPQALISCDTKTNSGCRGGSSVGAWFYFANQGIPTDECYPYTSGGGDNGICKTTCADSSPFVNYRAKLDSVFLILLDVEAAQNAIMTNGPIVATYDVYQDFYSYKSGVYTHLSGYYTGSHAVKVIGWGVDSASGYDYWLISNSWGPDWGDLVGDFNSHNTVSFCGLTLSISIFFIISGFDVLSGWELLDSKGQQRMCS